MPESLTDRERTILRSVLADYADRIARVDVFGSRARRTHRPGSDLDLLIYGDMDFDAMARLAAALDDSDLSITVDLHLFGDAGQEALIDHALSEAKTLFVRADLVAPRE